MRIVHVANFYGPKSGGIRTTLHELGKGYKARGHEFTYIVPGNGFFCEESVFGKKITVPSIVLPFSGGYRIIRNNKFITFTGVYTFSKFSTFCITGNLL